MLKSTAGKGSKEKKYEKIDDVIRDNSKHQITKKNAQPIQSVYLYSNIAGSFLFSGGKVIDFEEFDIKEKSMAKKSIVKYYNFLENKRVSEEEIRILKRFIRKVCENKANLLNHSDDNNQNDDNGNVRSIVFVDESKITEMRDIINNEIVNKQIINKNSINKDIVSKERIFRDFNEKCVDLRPIKASFFDSNDFNEAVLKILRNEQIYNVLKRNTMELTREKIVNSMDYSVSVINAIRSIDAIDKVVNIISKRVRDWYDIYFPELIDLLTDSSKIVSFGTKIMNFNGAEKDNKESMSDEFHKVLSDVYSDYGLNYDKSVGKRCSFRDIEVIAVFSNQLRNLTNDRERLEQYIEEILDEHTPNLKVVAGTLIAARLIEKVGSVRNLAVLPSSSIQVLGAEDALFRHLKTGSRPPKYGILYQHPLIQKVKPSLRGKAARMLADKISMAVKVDYFKVNKTNNKDTGVINNITDMSSENEKDRVSSRVSLGEKLKKDLEERFSVKW
ncbi:MAG: hypothetical protein GWP09_01795 [Nitrospiraceae bacterium]|nr:hypothetical protein [Nitrospiraceae bacterium]